MSLNYRIIGTRIKTARLKRKLSQAELSEIIDLTPSYMSYIETASKSLSLTTLVQLANALGVSADYLLGDNLTTSKADPHDEFFDLLKDCTTYEKRVIKEVAQSVKTILRNNRSH